MIDFVEEWGRRLLASAFAYSVVAMIVTWGFAAAGLEPPPLVPRAILDLYTASVSQWNSIAGLVASGDVLSLSLALLQSIVGFTTTVLGLFAAAVLAYVWLAVVLTQSLPGPLVVLAVPVWVAASLANTILAMYLVMKVRDVVETVRSLLGV